VNILNLKFIHWSKIMNQYQKKYNKSTILEINEDLNKTLETPKEKARIVHIIVTSEKQLKLDAAENIVKLNPRFKESTFVVKGFKSSSGIAEQPISMEAGEKGALNRIQSTKNLPSFQEYLKQIDDNDSVVIFVSIENYFTKPNQNNSSFDHAMVLIENEYKDIFKYVSNGVELNGEFYQKALLKGETIDGTGLNVTLGEVFSEVYPEVSSSDWHGFVTKDENSDGISRREQILTCIKNKKWF
jgi:mannose/fructose/N-acetylgalactosamine-specific phosphotransferase system component IIB